MSKSANRRLGLAAEVPQAKEEQKVKKELKVEVNPPKPSDDDSAIVRCLERLARNSEAHLKRMNSLDKRLTALEEICSACKADDEVDDELDCQKPEPQDSPAPQWPELIANQQAQPVEPSKAEPVLRYAYWDKKIGRYAYEDSKRNLLDAKRIGGGDWDRCWCWNKGGEFIPLSSEEMKKYVH